LAAAASSPAATGGGFSCCVESALKHRKFQFVINIKTVKALGLTVPQSISSAPMK